MMVTSPSPASLTLATLSHKGRGLKKAAPSNQPSPLVGEGALQAKRSKAGEGAKLKFAKHLRKNMTEVEKKLWQELRAKRFEGFKFRRQVPIGNYIVDFICHEHKLILELDGSQHEGSNYDVKRDHYLKTEGFRVLRFWNIDVNQAMDGTLLAILDALK